MDEMKMENTLGQPEFKLEIFSGPLDLLLHLLAKNKVSIYDIPIVQIVDQYMEYLDSMKSFNVDIASSFVEMAAHLLLIKSRTLLPRDEELSDEDDPRAQLVRALEEYQAIQAATVYFKEQNKIWQQIFTKEPEPLEKGPYEVQHSVSLLLAAVNDLLDKQERAKPVDPASFAPIVQKEAVSISSKIAQISALLLRAKKISLYDIYRQNKTKSEFVAVFLALLELCKSNKILCEETGKGVMIRVRGT